MCVCSVMSNSLRPHGLQPVRLLCPWNFSGKSTAVGYYSLLQSIVPTWGLNRVCCISCIGRQILSHLGSHGGSQWEHYSCYYSHQQHPFWASWQEDDQKEGLPLPLWREILRRAYPERQELCFWLGVHRSQWQVTHTSVCSPCLMHPPPHQPPRILSYTREHVCVLVHTHTHLLPQAKHAPGTWTSPGPSGTQPSTPAIARDPGQ